MPFCNYADLRGIHLCAQPQIRALGAMVGSSRSHRGERQDLRRIMRAPATLCAVPNSFRRRQRVRGEIRPPEAAAHMCAYRGRRARSGRTTIRPGDRTCSRGILEPEPFVVPVLSITIAPLIYHNLLLPWFRDIIYDLFYNL